MDSSIPSNNIWRFGPKMYVGLALPACLSSVFASATLISQILNSESQTGDVVLELTNTKESWCATSESLPSDLGCQSLWDKPVCKKGHADISAQCLTIADHAGTQIIIKDVLAKLIENCGDPRAGAYLTQRISLAVQRGNSVLGTMPQKLLDGVELL